MITGYSVIVPETSQGPLMEVGLARIEGTARVRSNFSYLTADQLSQRNFENCQPALVMFQNSEDETLSGTARDFRTAEVLLLPWTWKELVTRVRAEKSAPEASGKNNVVQFGRVRIELSSMEVRRGELFVRLTAMEFKLLRFFLGNPKRVISRDELLSAVWGYGNYPNTRTVDNHIMKLRRKLEPDPANSTHFRTVHGIGYKFVP